MLDHIHCHSLCFKLNILTLLVYFYVCWSRLQRWMGFPLVVVVVVVVVDDEDEDEDADDEKEEEEREEEITIKVDVL